MMRWNKNQKEWTLEECHCPSDSVSSKESLALAKNLSLEKSFKALVLKITLE